MTMRRWTGRRDADDFPVVEMDGQKFDALKSLTVRTHSPTGFEWGYEGSGPAQLALAIMLEIVGDVETAQLLYQSFKRDVIARLPEREWVLTEENCIRWLNEQPTI